MKQGDVVLVWGATGGIGGYAVQYVLNGGGTPVGVVSLARQGGAAQRARLSRRSSTARPRTTGSGRTRTPRTSREWRRFGKEIRELVGEDPDIVFEHPGRQTMGASIFVAKRGGTVVTCAATSRLHGRVRQPPLLDEAEAADLQPLRQLRRGVGGQPADRPGPHPAAAVGRVPARRGRRGRPRRSTATSTRARSACSAWRPTEGLGIDDPEKRERIGEDKITPLPPPRRLTGRRARQPGGRASSCGPRVATVGSMGMLLTEIDHVAIAVSDLEAAIDYYQRAFGATVDHREVVESDGVEEALLKVADSYIQLTTADARRLADRQVHREARRGPAPHRLPRRRLRRGAGGDGRRRRHADRPGPAPGQPRHDGGLRPPQGQLRHADRARPGVSSRAWRIGAIVTVSATTPAVAPAAVLWDMDGTLVDTEPYWMECEHELVDAFGGQWTEEDARSIIGFDLLDAAVVLREPGRGRPRAARDRRAPARRRHRPRPGDACRGDPAPGDCCRSSTSSACPCALVTMSWSRLVDAVVAALAPITFQAIITGDNVRARQAAPRAVPAGRRSSSASTHGSAWRSRTPRPAWRRPARRAAWCSPSRTWCRSTRRPAATSCRAQGGVTAGPRPLPRRDATTGHAAADREPARRRRLAGAPLILGGGLLAVVAVVLPSRPTCSVAVATATTPRRVRPAPSTSTPGRRTGRSTTRCRSSPPTPTRCTSCRRSGAGRRASTRSRSRPTRRRSRPRRSSARPARRDVPLVASILDGTEAGVMAGILADPAQRARHVDGHRRVRRRRRLRRHRHRLRAVRLRRRSRTRGRRPGRTGWRSWTSWRPPARRRSHAHRQHPARLRRRPDRRQRVLGLRLRGDHPARRCRSG